MMDTSHIDLLALLASDTELKRKASTGGGEWKGPCPFCGGKDRFSVQPYRPGGGHWYCRGCDKHGDAITYIMERDRVAFKEACEMLRLDLPRETKSSNRVTMTERAKVRVEHDQVALTDPNWARQASAFVQECLPNINGADTRGFQYWQHRGLTRDVIIEHELGFNPRTIQAYWGATKVWLPRSNVIPHKIQGRYWNIRLRRLDGDLNDGDSKYISPAGGASGLYRGDRLFFGCTAVICEGEIDALSILVGAPDLVHRFALVPVATGSTTGARLLDSIAWLAKADRVILAFDADSSGDQQANWWIERFHGRSVRLRPTQHDVNEMLQLGVDIEAWLRGVL